MLFRSKGQDIKVKSINFSVDSDFKESSKDPLRINFFDGKYWTFNKFSNSLLDKNWGCYDERAGSEGPLIGNSLYCEMIPIGNSGLIKMGARVTGNDNKELEMVLFPETGTGEIGRASCRERV